MELGFRREIQSPSGCLGYNMLISEAAGGQGQPCALRRKSDSSARKTETDFLASPEQRLFLPKTPVDNYPTCFLSQSPLGAGEHGGRLARPWCLELAVSGAEAQLDHLATQAPDL